METYAQACDLVVNLLKAHPTGLGVETTSIREGVLGQILPPPFVDCYFFPSTLVQVNNLGSTYANMVQCELFVGVPGEDTLSGSLRSGMLLVGKIMTLLETIGATFDESGPIQVEDSKSDVTIFRLRFVVPYDPYVAVEAEPIPGGD